MRNLLSVLSTLCILCMASPAHAITPYFVEQAMPPAAIAVESAISVGQVLPAFGLTTPDGKILKNEDLKGRVIVFDFWATWCAPCKKLTAEIDNALATYHEKPNFLMVGVNFREYNRDAALKYWVEHGYKFPMASDKDLFGKSIKAGNPTILVVDKNGVVQGRWDAYTPETAQAVKKLVDSLL